MKELGIADVIIEMRRRKGITQEDLASYIGVSKASVSKWETGQSYPDITFLPLLASYFSITIDELLRYEPQMSASDIRLMAQRLGEDFLHKPFDEVHAECKQIIQKYYGCFPLLFAMGSILLNHSFLAEPSKHMNIFEECVALFQRVRTESDNAHLAMQATEMEAACCIAAGEPKRTLALLETDFHFEQPTQVLIAAAQQQLGDKNQAIVTLQTGVYEKLMITVDLLNNLLAAYMDDEEKFSIIAARIQRLSDAFDLRIIHPGMTLNLYAILATGYAKQGRVREALSALETYWTYAKDTLPQIKLRGDSFFDKIDQFLSELDMGTAPPRSPGMILKSVIESIVSNPAFDILSDEPGYIRIRNEALSMKGGGL